MEKGRWRPPRHEPARPPDHDEHHGQAENQHAVILQLAKALGASHENDGCDDHAKLAAKPAKHDDGQNQCGFHECKRLGADKALTRGEECPCEAAEHRADGERRELRDDGVDADRAAGDFILA